jgi:hypothetical protein
MRQAALLTSEGAKYARAARRRLNFQTGNSMAGFNRLKLLHFILRHWWFLAAKMSSSPGSPVVNVAKSENNTNTFEPNTDVAFLIKSVVCLC